MCSRNDHPPYATSDEVRKFYGIPDYVEMEPDRETTLGIGAQDATAIDYTNVTEYREGAEVPWLEAGEAYALARRGANEMRALAFETMVAGSDWGLLALARGKVAEAQGHPHPAEEKRGIPAW